MDNCGCKDEIKAVNLFVLPGGGLSSVHYGLGVYKALHNAGLLLTPEGDFNYDNVFIASSGGTVSTYLVMCCIHLKLHKLYPDTWFEEFVESVIKKIDTVKILSVYTLSQLSVLCIENLQFDLLTDILYNQINSVLIDIRPTEFANQMGPNFKNGPFANNFRFNYIKVENQKIPFMTDDNTDLTGQTVIEQFKSIVRSCCTINGMSYTRFFQNHDAAMYIPSYINCLSQYMENPNLRNIYFYTIKSFDEYSYDTLIFKNSFNIKERDELETNYFLIDYLKNESKKYNKNFKLINPPNKFYIIQKFNVALYNELQQRINYRQDFQGFERFSGFFLFQDNLKMLQLITLFGYYETLYAVKQTNETNKQKLSEFKNINYEYLSTLVYDPIALDVFVDKVSCKKLGLFQLHKPQTIQIVMDIIDYKHIDGVGVLEQCFHNYSGKRSNNIAKLKEYLIYMQGYIYDGELKAKYKKILPVQKGTNKKIWTNPEKCLSKEYQNVSNNCVRIYFPNTFS